MNRRVACGLTLWTAFLLGALAVAQQPRPPAPQPPAPQPPPAQTQPAAAPPADSNPQPIADPVAEARAELRAAEAAHPGNTVEVANALNKLVGIEVQERGDIQESQGLANRELAVAEAVAGKRSKLYVAASATSHLLTWCSASRWRL